MLWTRRALLETCFAMLTGPAFAQERTPRSTEPELKPDFVCPMDPDVHSALPGKCPRCGMQLQAHILEPQAYSMDFTAQPASLPAGRPVDLSFSINDPNTGALVKNFDFVHEKLFHLFAVSQDLKWFLHDHPVLGGDGLFKLPVTFPSGGMYELFADFYPRGGTPQWIPRFLYTQGAEPRSSPRASKTSDEVKYTNPQKDGDVEVNLQLDPIEPMAGRATTLFFNANPGDGLELWLGTYAHAFWISHDLLDAEHTHPAFFGNLQFEVYFPRPGVYRFWLQFQRKGTLHTMKFDIPVKG